MNTTQFDKIIDRKNSDSEKWNALTKLYGQEDILPLWVADMDFAAPPAVAAAIQARAAHGVYGYALRHPDYFTVVKRWLDKRHGWTVASEWLCPAPSTVTSMSIAINTFTAPGDKIVIQPPVYPRFFSVVTQNGRRLAENRLISRGGRTTFDLDDLESKFRAGAKMMILCSPHNPVGRVWSHAELCSLAEVCQKHDVLLIADEIHSDLIFAGAKHIPLASLDNSLAERTITLISPSKTFNVAGLASSIAVIQDEELRTKFKEALKAVNIDEGNIFGNIALHAAYQDGEEWLEELLEYLEVNANTVVDFFTKHNLGIQVTKPEATYLAWLDCRSLGLDDHELNSFFVDRAKVGLSAGARFGDPGRGFMRLNFGCPRATLLTGLERMRQALQHYQEHS
jgi:cystathionine beta-lyase